MLEQQCLEGAFTFAAVLNMPSKLPLPLAVGAVPGGKSNMEVSPPCCSHCLEWFQWWGWGILHGALRRCAKHCALHGWYEWWLVVVLRTKGHREDGRKGQSGLIAVPAGRAVLGQQREWGCLMQARQVTEQSTNSSNKQQEPGDGREHKGP